MNETTYDTIIVGGGMAGLTAAAFLARDGQKILLIEKNKELGGLVNSFKRNGFHYDAGVRALEDAGIILPMLKDLNIEIERVRSRVSLGIENEIIHIENIDSLVEYRNMLTRFYPENKDEIDDIIKTIKKIMRHMDVLYGIENPLFKNLKRDTSFILKKLLPWLPRFLFTIGKINRMQLPVEEYLASKISNPSLKDIIAQHFFKNTPTFFALSYFSLYLDYFYPKGGVGKLAEAVRDRILALGGELLTQTTISRVLPSNKTVIDANGRVYSYQHLIWAADLKTLYNTTDTKGLTDNTINAFEDTKASLMAHRGGESVFTLFLQIDEPLESFEKIAHGHFFYTPSSKGLGSVHREELQELLDHFDHKSRTEILQWLDRFLQLNTFEISIPGLKDKDLVPPGKTGMIISFLADYALFSRVEEAGWLEIFVSEIETKLISIIGNTVFPVLKEKIIGQFSFSPLSIQHRIGSSEGAIVGWEFQKNMPVINKIQHAARSVATPLPSVYQAGQWSYSPAGVPMSILTGKIAADKIIQNASRKN